MARTAVIAGTATAVSKGVSGSMDQRAAQQQQQAAAAQPNPPQPQPASPGTNTDTLIAQLQQLADLQKQGILTPEEFAQQKARILGGTS